MRLRFDRAFVLNILRLIIDIVRNLIVGVKLEH